VYLKLSDFELTSQIPLALDVSASSALTGRSKAARMPVTNAKPARTSRLPLKDPEI
jgi:hypothetical protein